MNESFKNPKNRTGEKRVQRKSYLDNIRMGTQQNEQRDVIPKKNLSKITSDPLMQDILSDTANTTLLKQGSANAKSAAGPSMHSAPADTAAQIVSENDPTELFAESAQNWATLAFS